MYHKMNKLIVTIILFFLLYIDKANSLIESEVFPEMVYQSALEEGNIETIKMYLELGQSPTKLNKKDLNPLAYAIKNNSVEMINLLIENKAKINDTFLDKTSLLMYCVMLEKNSLINVIIENGINIDLQDSLGRTALMIAVEKENLDAIKKILFHKPDIKATDFSGNSIFDHSKYVRDRKVKELINSLNF